MRRLLASLLTLFCLFATIQARPGVAAPPATPEIWYDPPSAAEWKALFQDDAPWPKAMRKVSYVSLVASAIRTMPPADIAAIGAFAKRHRIKLALVLQPVAKYRTDTCGGGEGYSYPGEMGDAARILRDAGITLDAIVLDEPAWFGHYNSDPNGCRLPAPDLADRTAQVVKEVLDLHPGARLVDIEPVPDVTDFPDWRQILTGLRLGLDRRLGRTFDSVELDVNWDNPGWRAAIKSMNLYLHQQNLGLGLIYNASPSATGEEGWFADAIGHFEEVEGGLGVLPAQAVFASWNAFGLRNIPESGPNTQTWLINRYVRDYASLFAQFEGAGVRGRLTSSHGKPIAGATVRGFVPGVDYAAQMPAKVVRDVVPAAAVSAIIGYRLNTECRCQGFNDVLIGPLQYRETSGGTASQTYLVPPVHAVYGGVVVDGETVGGILATRVIAGAGQAFGPNSPIFPVTPGANYTFTVPATTVGGDGWYGNVIIIWIDANGNGLFRTYVLPDRGRLPAGSAVTDADGRFVLPHLSRTGTNGAPVTVEFAGDDTHHAATWSPLTPAP